MHWKLNFVIYLIWSLLSRQYETKVFHSIVFRLKLNSLIVIHENYEIDLLQHNSSLFDKVKSI